MTIFKYNLRGVNEKLVITFDGNLYKGYIAILVSNDGAAEIETWKLFCESESLASVMIEFRKSGFQIIL